MPTYNIDINKIYQFPEEICEINFADSILVIAPAFANWIVLKSASQVSIFDFLRKGYSIKDTLSKNIFSKDDVSFVVTQIEARRFYVTRIKRSNDQNRSMHLYLTNGCNLSCPHCYMFSGIVNREELSTKEIFDLIYDFKKVTKGSSITISGGEPSTRADFDDVVKYSSDLGLKVKVLTNGTLMTPERVVSLSKYLYSIQISIDGYSEETNSLIRGKGSFQKSLEAVDSFVRHGVKTSIAVTPAYKTLKNHVNEYVDFARNLLAKYKGYPFQIKFSDGLIDGRNIKPSERYNHDYYTFYKKIQEDLYGPDFDAISFAHSFKNGIIIDNCMFGLFSIASNGNVYFCARIEKLMPVANVRSTSFHEIYIKSKAAQEATAVCKLEPCKSCELRFICGGGCRIDEFPELVYRTSFEYINYSKVPPRHCNQKIKNMFYDLMIRSNKFLYKPIYT